MYVRLFTVMVIGLYTSRLVLEILGVSDYGLFSVVGGVLAMFTFISSSLSSATSRFFNTEMGKGGDVNASFNINLVLHVAMAILVFAFAESIGLWYVYNYLNVAADKLPDAVFVYHVSILTACLGIVNSPYQSLFCAYERFEFMAILDIVNSFVRLGCILLLSLYHGTFALRIYSVIFALTTVNTFVVYHYVAYRRWPAIIRRRFVRGWNEYREVLDFGGWNLFATMAYMANSSGVDLLLNAFFGTPMNGAFAVSKTVKTNIMNFTGNFDNASAPQIIQSYAAGDCQRYTYLCNKLGRINILVFELMCFPLLAELPFLLQIWLGKVPDGAYELTFLSIIQGGIALTAGGIYNLINATGRIKWFKINVSFFFLVCLPLGYWMFSIGMPYYSILLLLIMADIVQRVIQLVLMRRILGFDACSYARSAYLRPGVIALLMAVAFCLRARVHIDTTFVHLLSMLATFVLALLLIYIIGLTDGERMALRKRLHV